MKYINIRSSTARRRCDAIVVAGPLIFAACLYVRAPNLLTNPRFWAEECNLYMASLQERGLFDSLFFVGNGNFQLLENITVAAALRVPSRLAAFPTTLASLALSLFCCAVICRFMQRHAVSVYAILSFCVLFALAPAGYEVFLNATNMQWIASIAVFFLCFSHDDQPSRRAFVSHVAAVFLLGLSGPAACITIIVYATWFAVRPTRFRLANLAAMAAATLIEAVVILVHRGDVTHRAFHASPVALVVYLMQALFGNFISGDLLDHVGEFLRNHGVWASGAGLQMALVGGALLSLIVCIAARKLPFRTVICILSGSLLASLVNIFGALENADVMLSGSAGGRYLVLGNTCNLMLLAVALDGPGRVARVSTFLLVCTVICNSVWTARSAEWAQQHLFGPSVAEQVDACGAKRPCKVKAWPGDEFQVELK